jgi:hypothetical protein
MSPLVLHQFDFLKDVARLIDHASSLPYVVTGGELWRPPETQDLYFRQGKSKVRVGGNHGKRLAIDLNIFNLDGSWSTLEQIRPLGVFWEGLSLYNRWGGNFTTLKDGPHFERDVRGVEVRENG